MTTPLAVPEAVRRKALALGSPGELWLAALGHVVAELERAWGIHVGTPIGGGSGGYVAEAVAADGTDAVLKIAIPDGLEGHGPFIRELRTLRLGAGRGYVRVLEVDESHRAMLQERLGRPLSDLGLPVESQIEIIATTLRHAWRETSEAAILRTGAEQAQFLGEFIVARWEELGQPCPRHTIDAAVQYAWARRDAFDPSTSVLIHGDAHPSNVLESLDPCEPGRFRLIDPDGMLSEPAHDLAIPLRDWTNELLAGDAVGLALEWCSQLSALAGVGSRAIWEWAFVERVSTGLFITWLGDDHGQHFLKVATRLADAEP